MPSVTVAILNYNGLSLLKTFLPSVLRCSKRCKILVIDNGSTDESVAFLKENHPEVSVINHDENYGFCKGYNKGLAGIESDYYVLLNSDVEVTDHWIEPIIELMENNPGIAACQPKILSYKEKSKFEYAGASGGFIDWLGYPFCRGRIFDYLEEDKGQYDDAIPVFWASGACFFVKANLFQEAGGFNEAFFAHMEEVDLCWRFQNAGYSIWCQPASKVYHLGGGTLEQGRPEKTYLNFRNNLSTLQSNLPKAKLLYILPIRAVLDLMAAFRFLFDSGPSHSWAVLRAYFSFMDIGRKQITEKQGKPIGLLSASIVFVYFVKRIRKFSKLSAF